MKIDTPNDCGNSPRLIQVRDFTVAWAIGDASAAELLLDSTTWTVAGTGTSYRGTEGFIETRPTEEPKRVVIHTVINHGKMASSDGYIESASGRQHFSHVFRFSGASKTAKIAAVRSYFVRQDH